LPPSAAVLAAGCRPFAHMPLEVSRFTHKFSIHGLGAPKLDRHGQHLPPPYMFKMQFSCQDRQ
jgi:hypothetical protein